jgi:hypothetical protein
MVSLKNPPEAKVSDTQSIIQESAERIRHALELESIKLKEKAELDSNQIINKAKEEAEQITAESRQKAAKAWQEPEQIISDAREQASQVIANIIDYSTTQVQNDFARVAAEARNKTAQMLIEIGQSVEQIISDTQKNIKAELERLSIITTEAESKLKALQEKDQKDTELIVQIAGETQNKEPASEKEAEVASQPVIEEETAPAEVTNEKQEINVPSGEVKLSTQVKVTEEENLFKGRLKLTIVSPYDQEHVGGVPEWLAQLPDLKVLSRVSHASANRWMTTYTIYLEKAMPLLNIIKSIPPVKSVSEQEGNFTVILK